MNYLIEPGDVILVPPEKEVPFSEAFTNIVSTIAQFATIFGIVITIVRLK